MKRYATSSFLLLSILLIQNSRASNSGLSDELRFLHREIGLLRDENQNQNYEIAMLKEMVGFHNNSTVPNNQIASLTTNELDEKRMIESLPKSTDQDRLPSSMSSRLKRPVRLLPPHLLRGEKNESSSNQPTPRFYGPPANCSDLSKLGYTLNGFYQIQSNVNTTNEDGLTTDTIYCAFKQPEGTFNPNAVQKRVNTINSINPKFFSISNPSKSSGGVHFHVQTTSPVKIVHGLKLLFDSIVFNVGGHYKSNTGAFILPKSGMYQFTFSGVVSYNGTSVWPRQQEQHFLIQLKAANKPKRTYELQVAENQLFNRVASKFYQGDEIYVRIVVLGTQHITLDLSATLSGFLLEEFVH